MQCFFLNMAGIRSANHRYLTQSSPITYSHPGYSLSNSIPPWVPLCQSDSTGSGNLFCDTSDRDNFSSFFLLVKSDPVTFNSQHKCLCLNILISILSSGADLLLLIMRYTNFSGRNVKTKLSSRKFRPESYLALTVHTSNMHFLFLWNRSYHIKSVHNLNWRLKSQIPKNQILALANSRKDTLNKLFWLFSVFQFYHERINGEGKCASLTGIWLVNGEKQQQQICHAAHIGEPRCTNAN